MKRFLIAAVVLASALPWLQACGSAASTKTGDDSPGASAGKAGHSTAGQAGAPAGGSAQGGEAGASQGGDGGQSAAGAGGDPQGGGGMEQGGSAQAGSGQAGSGQAGSGQAGSGQAGSGQAGAGGVPANASLAIVPADAVLSPAAGVSPSLPYKALLQSPTAPDKDVTAQTVFTVDPPSFGAFSGSLFTAPAGALGTATVKASGSGLFASTSVTIKPPQVIIGPGAAPDAPGKFGGGAGGPAPSVVYPNDGVLVPPNMNSLEFHFIPGAGQTLFQLEFASKNVSLSVYVGCTPLSNGCVYTPDAAFWKLLANTARGGEPVTYKVKGVNGGAPGQVGVSASRTIQFSTDDLSGGLYYWNSGGTIQRYDFGFPQQAETYLNPASAGGAICVGCHALSRNGKLIAVGLNIPAPSVYQVRDVATKALVFQSGGGVPGGNFFSFSPDASQLLVSDGTKMEIRASTNGALVAGGTVKGASMPDWSPDGKQVVYGRPGTVLPFAAPGISDGRIDVVSWNGSAFGAPKTLVPFAGANNYYPAFSPDNAWIIFNRSPSNRDSMSNASIDDQTGAMPDGQLWLIPSGGGTPIHLQKGGGDGDQWAKWTPTVQSYEKGPVQWVTFSSRREYGLRLGKQVRTQLWMAAIDPAKAASGVDPSFPAFWLPFQDLKTGNHIAQWVVKVERKPCGAQGECSGSEVCYKERCVPYKP